MNYIVSTWKVGETVVGAEGAGEQRVVEEDHDINTWDRREDDDREEVVVHDVNGEHQIDKDAIDRRVVLLGEEMTDKKIRRDCISSRIDPNFGSFVLHVNKQGAIKKALQRLLDDHLSVDANGAISFPCVCGAEFSKKVGYYKKEGEGFFSSDF